MNWHRFKLYRAYSISFTSSNVGKCFWSWILKDCIKVEEKRRKLLSCVPVLDKTWIQALCSRATTVKKCTKKARCKCKVVVLLIKPIAFFPFSLPSASSLLKLSNILVPGSPTDSTNYWKCVSSSLQSDWKIDNGFFNRSIMARTQILVHRWGPRTRILALFRRRTCRKWLIKRRGANFIFPVIGTVLIRERRLFQLLVKHWGEYKKN